MWCTWIMGREGKARSRRTLATNSSIFPWYATASASVLVSLSPWNHRSALISPPPLTLSLALFTMSSYSFSPRAHSFMAVPPTAHGTSATTPTRSLTPFANDIPGPTPHVFFVSMSAWRGSRAASHSSFALSRSIEGCGCDSGGTTPSQRLGFFDTPPRPAMLLCPDKMKICLFWGSGSGSLVVAMIPIRGLVGRWWWWWLVYIIPSGGVSSRR